MPLAIIERSFGATGTSFGLWRGALEVVGRKDRAVLWQMSKLQTQAERLRHFCKYRRRRLRTYFPQILVDREES